MKYTLRLLHIVIPMNQDTPKCWFQVFERTFSTNSDPQVGDTIFFGSRWKFKVLRVGHEVQGSSTRPIKMIEGQNDMESSVNSGETFLKLKESFYTSETSGALKLVYRSEKPETEDEMKERFGKFC
jgi:hypothetical protein